MEEHNRLDFYMGHCKKQASREQARPHTAYRKHTAVPYQLYELATKKHSKNSQAQAFPTAAKTAPTFPAGKALSWSTDCSGTPHEPSASFIFSILWLKAEWTAKLSRRRFVTGQSLLTSCSQASWARSLSVSSSDIQQVLQQAVNTAAHSPRLLTQNRPYSLWLKKGEGWEWRSKNQPQTAGSKISLGPVHLAGCTYPLRKGLKKFWEAFWQAVSNIHSFLISSQSAGKCSAGHPHFIMYALRSSGTSQVL